MQLVIGNKNYSSWSMRPWLLMTELGISFEEERLSFNDPEWKARARRFAPTGMVPVLVDGELTIWDTLAIVEYLAERYPGQGVWPAVAAARARARSITAEMHAGFSALRNAMPMNCELRVTMRPLDRAVRADIARVCAIWADCRAQVAPGGGAYLFGAFSAADAFYGPVVRRFVSYGAELPAAAQEYVATMEALPAMRAWMAGALAEKEFVGWEEGFRDGPG
jgi:glutathione S-transferase